MGVQQQPDQKLGRGAIFGRSVTILVLDDFFQELRPRSTSLERVLVGDKIRKTVDLERKEA